MVSCKRRAKVQYEKVQKCFATQNCQKVMTVTLCAAILLTFFGLVAKTVTETINQNDHQSVNLKLQLSNEKLSNFKDNDHAHVPDPVTSVCSIESCKVNCRDLDENEIVEEIMKLDLEDKGCSYIDLTLDSCNLSAGGGIQRHFLSELSVEIKQLELVNLRVIHIMIDAFNTPVFNDRLSYLRIDNSWTGSSSENVTLQLFSDLVFAGLTALTTLTLQNIGMLQVIDRTSLQKLRESLTTLTVTKIGSPWNPGDLLGEVTMKTLSKVDFPNNIIRNLNKPMFTGIAECVTSLNLQSSEVETVDPNTFEGFTKMKNLYLQYNKISTIDHNIFNELLLVSGFKVNLQNNKWNCVCEMLPLKEMILENMDSFSANVRCDAPDDMKGLVLTQADVCHLETTTEEDTTTTPEEEPPTEEPTTTTTEETTSTSTRTTPTTTKTTEPPTSPPTDPPTDSSTSQDTSPSTNPQTSSEDTTTTTTTEEPTTTPETTDTTETTKLTTITELPIECYRSSFSKVNSRNSSAKNSASDSFNIHNSPISFTFEDSLTEFEVQISFADYYEEVKLVYYPGTLDTSQLSKEVIGKSVKCVIVNVAKVVISDLQPSTVYTFCALFPNESIESPFQCKSHQTKLSFDQTPWIAQDKKTLALGAFLAAVIIVFIVGILLTYLVIRRMPRLVKSKKRVVRVYSQPREETPVCSRESSMQKQINTFEHMEAPIYMTPQPPQSRDNGQRPAFVRSSSDESIGARSYVSVSKCPPRFSQVFLPSDFVRELPKRCESLPHSRASLRCHSPNPIPPPLPRRSIASTISVAEMRKPSKNSIFRPRRISDDMEDHYNIII